MAKRSSSLFLPSFFILSLTILTLQLQGEAASSTPSVPAMFIFGDSTVDVGTNNFIPDCTAKANFRFNGIDYPYSVPTGRFSNGFNTADQIARLLGFKRSPPPFFALLNHTASFKCNILYGANFASGGSGILDTTGLRFHKVIPLGEQIQQFSTVCRNITELMNNNSKATASLLSKSFFLISVGSNDVFEYNRTVSAPQFLFDLLYSYQNHLKNLYDLGARKFGVLSVPPIGYIPAVRANCSNDHTCAEEANGFARAFHTETKTFLKQFKSEHKDMEYSLGNTYEMTLNIIQDPLVFGLKDVQTACCGKGYLGADTPCNQTANLCLNRGEYLFWDRFHPTERACEMAALTVYGGATNLVTPMNFSRLLGVYV